MEPLLNALDDVRRTVNSRTQRAERSDIGQFLTPVAIARFMASLFAPNRSGSCQDSRCRGRGGRALFSLCGDVGFRSEDRLFPLRSSPMKMTVGILPELVQTAELL